MRMHVAIGTFLALALPSSAAAAELQAAYEQHVPGQGFEIKLINAATGAARTLPAGVNTAADELHPALSPDGRHLVFTRMQLQAQFNGNIVVPAARSLIQVDLQTGAQTNLGTATGATFTAFGSTPELAFGVPAETPSTPRQEGATRVARSLVGSDQQDVFADVAATNLDTVHAASIRNLFSENITGQGCQPCSATRTARYLGLAYHDPATGALQNGVVRLSLVGMFGVFSSINTFSVLHFGSATAPAGHPVARPGDGYVAFHQLLGSNADIQGLLYPRVTQPEAANGTGMRTSLHERMPAWSPDGSKLGFVRTALTGSRLLLIYDSTPGIQAVSAPITLGAQASTPQLRQIQDVYGGLSLANIPAAPATSCGSTCVSSLNRGTLTLSPTVTKVISGQSIGIFVVRRTGGTRTILGVKQPRIKVIGRVPLGKTKKGTNRFRWDLRVNGKRLKPGRYLLTYRLLRGGAVTTTSDSIPFRVR
jgi:hypothetical protein